MARSGVIYGDTEVWKAVPGADGYVASSHGRVARVVGHKSASGYIHVEMPGKLYMRGHSVGAAPRARHKYRVYAHHIVALTFLGDPPLGKDKINHKDGVRSNNEVSNIEWCDQSHNIKHSWREGGLRRKVATRG